MIEPTSGVKYWAPCRPTTPAVGSGPIHDSRSSTGKIYGQSRRDAAILALPYGSGLRRAVALGPDIGVYPLLLTPDTGRILAQMESAQRRCSRASAALRDRLVAYAGWVEPNSARGRTSNRVVPLLGRWIGAGVQCYGRWPEWAVRTGSICRSADPSFLTTTKARLGLQASSVAPSTSSSHPRLAGLLSMAGRMPGHPNLVETFRSS